MAKFESTEANELLSLAYYAEKISKNAEKKMLKGKVLPENLFQFKRLVNELVGKNKEIISIKAKELLDIDEGKRIGR